MIHLNTNQVQTDEFNTRWAEIDGRLFELFGPDEDFTEEAMVEAGYEPTSLTLGDVSPKHRGTVYENDTLFIRRY